MITIAENADTFLNDNVNWNINNLTKINYCNDYLQNLFNTDHILYVVFNKLIKGARIDELTDSQSKKNKFTNIVDDYYYKIVYDTNVEPSEIFRDELRVKIKSNNNIQVGGSGSASGVKAPGVVDTAVTNELNIFCDGINNLRLTYWTGMEDENNNACIYNIQAAPGAGGDNMEVENNIQEAQGEGEGEAAPAPASASAPGTEAGAGPGAPEVPGTGAGPGTGTEAGAARDEYDEYMKELSKNQFLLLQYFENNIDSNELEFKFDSTDLYNFQLYFNDDGLKAEKINDPQKLETQPEACINPHQMTQEGTPKRPLGDEMQSIGKMTIPRERQLVNQDQNNSNKYINILDDDDDESTLPLYTTDAKLDKEFKEYLNNNGRLGKDAFTGDSLNNTNDYYQYIINEWEARTQPQNSSGSSRHFIKSIFIPSFKTIVNTTYNELKIFFPEDADDNIDELINLEDEFKDFKALPSPPAAPPAPPPAPPAVGQAVGPASASPQQLSEELLGSKEPEESRTGNSVDYNSVMIFLMKKSGITHEGKDNAKPAQSTQPTSLFGNIKTGSGKRKIIKSTRKKNNKLKTKRRNTKKKIKKKIKKINKSVKRKNKNQKKKNTRKK